MADLYKPVSESTGTPAYLTDSSIAPVLQLADGTLIRGRDTGASNGRKHTWRFDINPASIGTFRIVNPNTNEPLSGVLQGGQRYEGGDFGSLRAVQGKGNLGSSSFGDSGLQSSMQGAGALSANLSGQFPTYQNAVFTPTPAVSLVDPQEYAGEFGEFNRGEFGKNFQVGQGFGLEQLQTELQGLKSFAPAAAALKRSETSIDNQFNQAQRTAQISGVIPDVLANLKGQTERAGILATGRLPSSIEDRALEIGLRSEGADIAATRGFGDDSLAGKKGSDIMSAKERLNISQLGDQLITTNAQTRSVLELAPTEYSAAGTEIKVMPEVGAGRAGTAIASELNQYGLVRAETALASKVAQEQTVVQNNQFNAQGSYNASLANAENQFTAQSGLFNYLNNRAHEVSSLDTAKINQEREDKIRAELTAFADKANSQAQRNNFWTNVLGALGASSSLINDISGIASNLGFGDFFGKSKTTTGTTTTNNTPVPNTTTPTTTVPTPTTPAPPNAIGQNTDGSFITKSATLTKQLHQYGIDYGQMVMDLGV